jgi:hypothetical protein
VFLWLAAVPAALAGAAAVYTGWRFPDRPSRIGLIAALAQFLLLGVIALATLRRRRHLPSAAGSGRAPAEAATAVVPAQPALVNGGPAAPALAGAEVVAVPATPAEVDPAPGATDAVAAATASEVALEAVPRSRPGNGTRPAKKRTAPAASGPLSERLGEGGGAATGATPRPRRTRKPKIEEGGTPAETP